ncbi:MAG: patatin-like phospholipase family protein, partial [Gammaproteobacteria bacterium]
MATVAEPGTANGRVKLGLALSGGGFRASFFHVGVLAQMAMQGLLRRVEVISTVSGGSIIGALYYLHLKRLLESDADSGLTDGHYQRLVEDIERDFFAAVQTNLRMSTFIDPAANYRISRPDCSRSDRIAELYNDRLYQGVLSGLEPPIKMRAVKIQPRGTDAGFHPERDNHGRSAKVPILLVNATTLNSGR